MILGYEFHARLSIGFNDKNRRIGGKANGSLRMLCAGSVHQKGQFHGYWSFINNILRTQRDQMETAFFNVFDTFTYECGEKYVKSHTRVVNDKVVKVRFIK